MIATIHQPDFMPWLGFYSKIAKSDIWVILDHVENNPRHKGYWNRVAILVQENFFWISTTIDKKNYAGRGGIPINEMKISDIEKKLYLKKIKTFEESYKKAPYFREALSLFENYYLSTEMSLAKRNINFILKTFKLLNIKIKIINSSSIEINTRSTQLLLDILKKVGADTYLHGSGAFEYQDDSLLINNGINLKANNFVHPIYKQISNKNFVQGLSVIDAIANIGTSALSKIILSK